jgi:A nuclease family of the HNH/ENDO VII superfamily with conserved AHH
MKIITLKIKNLLLILFCCTLLFSCKKEIIENEAKIETTFQITDDLRNLIKQKLTTVDYNNIDWNETVLKKILNTDFKLIQIPLKDKASANTKTFALISLKGENNNFYNGQIIKIETSSFDTSNQMNGRYYEADLNRTNEQYSDIVNGIKIDNSNTSNLAASYLPQVYFSLGSWFNLLDALGLGGIYTGVGSSPNTSGNGGGSSSNNATYTYNSLYLSNILQLNTVQREWLNTHVNEAQDIYTSIIDSRNIDDNDVPVDYTPYEAIQASKITIAVAMANQINGTYDVTHFNTYIAPQLTPAQTQLIIIPTYWLNFSILCAEIREEHPEWSNAKIYWEASLEILHLALDFAGMVPGFGEVADLANGVIYTLSGDGVNASFSFAAMIPFYGWASTSAKWAKKTITALNGTKRTLKWFKQATGLITFGSRNQLRKVLGLTVRDLRQAHHLIPWEHWNSLLVQKAAHAKFHLNEILNGIPLTTIQHNGSHNIYNDLVESKLGQLWAQNGGAGMSNETAEALVRNLANQIRDWIVSHPNQSINNLILP